MGQFQDLTGQQFGRLTVLHRAMDCYSKSGIKKIMWLCKCDCGNTKEVSSNSLTNGTTSSCGCLKKELLAKRNKETAKWKGDTAQHKRLANIWHTMIKRCDRPNRNDQHLYYDKGIKVCPEWYDWFTFKEWALSHGYTDELTIDRIDSNGNYEPNNCRWVTQKVQANNTSKNKLITYKDKTQTLSQWCDELNLDYFRTKARLNNCNYTPEEAFELDRYELRESNK